MTNDDRIPIVLTFDIEPDARLIDKSARLPWSGFEKLHRHLSELRRETMRSDCPPLRFSWYMRMDPQIAEAYGDPAWGAKRYAAEIGAVMSARDSLGLHVHAFRWNASGAHWIADHGNRDWIEHCVRTSATAFEDAFHRRSLTYRMGDRYVDETTLALMESLGGRVDLTVEPGYPPAPAVFVEEPYTGSLPDLRDAPTRPYHPSPTNFRRVDPSGNRALAIVPLSTWTVARPVGLARGVYAAALALRGRPVPTVLKSGRTMTCGLAVPSWIFRRMVDHLLARPHPYIASIDRSHVGNEPAKLRRIGDNLRYLLSHPLAHRFAFVAPDEVTV